MSNTAASRAEKCTEFNISKFIYKLPKMILMMMIWPCRHQAV